MSPRFSFRLRMACVAVALLSVTTASAQSFSDDFNRPDGNVGNGWSTWGAGATIESGRLKTVGLLSTTLSL